MLDAFETCLLDFSLSLGLLPDCGNVLVAVSGGADSVALLYGLKRLKDDGSVGCDFIVGHINHNLRGCDSDGDEGFVKRVAGELGFRCITRGVDVRGYAERKNLSIETAARDLRIECLIEIANQFNCDCIATAHHADDNAETVIHRMSRGTGYRGLCGINPKTDFTLNGMAAIYIRPLLCVSKDDILAYCKGNGIQWRHDHTNDEFDYTRNKIRHLLIPNLQEHCGREVVGILSELSAACQKLYKRIERKIETQKDQLFPQDSSGRILVAANILRELPPVIQGDVIRRALVKVGCGQRFVTRKHYRQIVGLLIGEGGKNIELPGGFIASLEHGNVIFYPPADATGLPITDEEKIEIKIPGTVEFGGFEIKAEVIDAGDCDLKKFIAEKSCDVEWFDMDKIIGSLYARKRKPGDKFVPIGMKGEKKVGKFLTASQIDYQLRKDLVVIEDDKQIIWVGPVRASQDTRIDESTMRILCLDIGYEKGDRHVHW